MFGVIKRMRRFRKGEKGFTLIELLVVIIIIAILAAIAIPTFLGQRQKAQDAAAKSLVRNARTAIETYYVDTRDFTGVTQAGLAAIEPGISWTAAAVANAATTAVVATADASKNQIAWGSLGVDSYQLGTVSKSGKIFGVTVNKATGATTFNPATW